MDHLHEITRHSRRLPENLQKEVLDFICFLEARHTVAPTVQEGGPTDAEINRACGILKATHGATLEQMDEAIKKRGAKL